MKLFRILYKTFKVVLVMFIILIASVFIYVKSSPKPIINSANNITLYDKDNNVFFKGNQSSEWVNLNDISDNVIKATISAEDKNFYKHFGFDIIRIIKAAFTNVVNGSTKQGASTITQQYAKNLFLDFNKTWKRKWEEALYTVKIEANYSKKQILEGYLNTINYGHGKLGIENASKYYFGKSSKELSLAEATILTAIPKAPSVYSPLTNFEACKKRQLLILDLMVKNNMISEEEKNTAYNTEVKLIGKEENETISNIYYYQDAIMNELKKIEVIPKNYSSLNGLKIYTSFDYNAQKILEDNIKNAFSDNSTLETSSVIMKRL